MIYKNVQLSILGAKAFCSTGRAIRATGFGRKLIYIDFYYLFVFCANKSLKYRIVSVWL